MSGNHNSTPYFRDSVCPGCGEQTLGVFMPCDWGYPHSKEAQVRKLEKYAQLVSEGKLIRADGCLCLDILVDAIAERLRETGNVV